MKLRRVGLSNTALANGKLLFCGVIFVIFVFGSFNARFNPKAEKD